MLIYTSWGTGPNLSHSMNDHSIFFPAIKALNKSQLKSMGDFHHFQGYRPKKLDAWGKSRQGKRKGKRNKCCCNIMALQHKQMRVRNTLVTILQQPWFSKAVHGSVYIEERHSLCKLLYGCKGSLFLCESFLCMSYFYMWLSPLLFRCS